jgi:hypothetical protein
LDQASRLEEFLVGAVQAIVHRADAEAVGDDLGTDAAAAVIDHERIAHAVQRVAEHRVFEPQRKGLRGGHFVVEHDGVFAERLEPVMQHGIAIALTFQRVSSGIELAVGTGTDDNRVDVRVHDLVGRGQHVDDR